MQTFKDYQILAARTCGAQGEQFTPNAFAKLHRPDGKLRVRIETTVLGLTGELGEFADIVKKMVGHGHKRDDAQLIKELGDNFWYIADLYSCFGLDMFDAASDQNGIIDKTAICVKKAMNEAIETTPWLYNESENYLISRYVRSCVRTACVVSDAVDALLVPDPVLRVFMPNVLDNHFGQLVALVAACNLDLRVVLESNIAKLRKRYPDGFSHEGSQNRKD